MVRCPTQTHPAYLLRVVQPSNPKNHPFRHSQEPKPDRVEQISYPPCPLWEGPQGLLPPKPEYRQHISLRSPCQLSPDLRDLALPRLLASDPGSVSLDIIISKIGAPWPHITCQVSRSRTSLAHRTTLPSALSRLRSRKPRGYIWAPRHFANKLSVFLRACMLVRSLLSTPARCATDLTACLHIVRAPPWRSTSVFRKPWHPIEQLATAWVPSRQRTNLSLSGRLLVPSLGRTARVAAHSLSRPLEEVAGSGTSGSRI